MNLVSQSISGLLPRALARRVLASAWRAAAAALLVLKAFQKVREGRPYLSHDLASEVAFMEARGTTNPLKRMTVRELQTLALVAEGKPYGVIAEHLHVSYKTVANTCTQLKAKLGVRTLPELMRIAIQHLPSATARPPK